MSWKRLEFDDLKRYLAQDELDKLKEISVDDAIENVVQDQLDIVSDAWRGALEGAGYELDPREHFTPSEYKHWILTFARYSIWTRFPNSPVYALDDARRKEYEEALNMMKSPTMNASKVNWDDPELKDYTRPSKSGSIWVPLQHIQDDLPTVKNWQVNTYCFGWYL